jgi:hypothetical protein
LPDLNAYTTIFNHYNVKFICTNPYYVLKNLRQEAEEKRQVNLKKWNEEAPLREARKKAEAIEKTTNNIFYYSLMIISFFSMIYLDKLSVPWTGAIYSIVLMFISRFFDKNFDADKNVGIIVFMIFANIFRLAHYYDKLYFG